MNIVIVNGSARKGNTFTAIDTLVKNFKQYEVSIIQADQLNMAPCMGCGVCECYKGCVAKDDTNKTVDELVNADMIIFASPVYWWGMSGQLKLVIDKCYSKGLQLKNKNVGVLIIGGSPTNNIQYELIHKQFECMAKYLSWDMKFYKSYYANKKDDLLNNLQAITELEEIAKLL